MRHPPSICARDDVATSGSGRQGGAALIQVNDPQAALGPAIAAGRASLVAARSATPSPN
jgi:hypothetical protein